MKSGYKQLTNTDDAHNEVHRQAFQQPETIYITSTEPTVDNTRLGEVKIYKSGSTYKRYTKVSRTEMSVETLSIA